MSGKLDFRPKKTTKGREKEILQNARKVHPEDIAILNSHAPNYRAAKYVKQN